MRETQIASLFHIRRRFLRSVHLERDFADSQALDGYVITPQTRSHLEHLADGLRDTSGQRAWRITGDYGSGKSSFALLLAHLLSERGNKLPGQLRNAVDFRKLGLPRPNLLPVLVTGSAEPIGVALLRAIVRELLMVSARGRIPSVVERMRLQIKRSESGTISDETVVRLVLEASEHIVSAEKGSGMLIILDELGKFLEYGALHPERQDVYLLQTLGEAASRSGRTPLFIVGLLHQGFHAYADHLTQSAQKEWEKVAGRFDELLFNQPLDHTATLIADALNIRTERVPKELRTRARRDMLAMLELGWYGASAARNHLIDLAERLYPLHPSVLPVLAKLFTRFGQNERSLFSFLLSGEPFGLQEFATRVVSERQFFRIHNLYDYARTTFGYRLGLQSFRSHWNHIESIIESFPAENKTELEILKTLGLLNVLDSIPLVGSEDALRICVQGDETGSSANVQTSVRRLRSRRVVYHRGVAGGFCLWPHTSVNLEKAYEEASKTLGGCPDRVAPLIQTYLETRPVVARRHYIETGNLRHFEVLFSPVSQLSDALSLNCEAADGRIVVALCETEEEREQAVRIATSDACAGEPAILFAIPNPLRALGKLLQEVRRWEWVVANTEELHNDSFATEEVTRQLTHAREALADRINGFVGLHQFGGSELQWYRKGQRIPVKSGREFLACLSDVCDQLYPGAPRFFNELINRRMLSSAAAAARTRLVEGIYTRSTEPYLGMDPKKKPPEMSMYLSLLKEPGIHRRMGEGWGLRVPPSGNDPCNTRPALERIRKILTEPTMRRVPVSEILLELRKPPFGIRDGLSPLLIAIFSVANEHHVAFYESEKFMQQMGGLDLVRLTKVPSNFEIQFCNVAGVRSELFSRLVKVLDLKVSSGKIRTNVLDVVRPLCVFAAKLPGYTLKTRRLSAHAVAVREVLLGAREPAVLLFRQLPEALGFAEFTSDRPTKDRGVDDFVQELKKSLDELRMNYSLVLTQMMATLAGALNLTESTDNLRKILAKRAQSVLIAVTELRLRAFCNRLLDIQMPEPEWLESLGSLVTGVPPVRWTDADLERYDQDLSQLCDRFRRVESIAFQMQTASASGSALRVVITRLDGSELDQVIHVNPEDDDQAFKVEAHVSALLKDSKAASLAGALRAFWKAIDPKDVSNA